MSKDREKIIKQRRRQQGEDEDEEREVIRGNHHESNKSTTAGNIAIGAIAVGALGIGAFLMSKVFSSSSDSPKKKSSIVKTSEKCRAKLCALMRDIDEYPVVGLDCQWSKDIDGVRSPIALLQISTRKGKIMLVPLKAIDGIPDELKALLRNPEIIKTGIRVSKDASYLQSDHGLEVRSTFDLRFLAEDTGNRPAGLEQLSKSVLDLDIGREWETVNSDWDKSSLESHQIAYAETSVKALIDIFSTLFTFTNSGSSKQDILNYCKTNLNRNFDWWTQKWNKIEALNVD